MIQRRISFIQFLVFALGLGAVVAPNCGYAQVAQQLSANTVNTQLGTSSESEVCKCQTPLPWDSCDNLPTELRDEAGCDVDDSQVTTEQEDAFFNEMFANDDCELVPRCKYIFASTLAQSSTSGTGSTTRHGVNTGTTTGSAPGGGAVPVPDLKFLPKITVNVLARLGRKQLDKAVSQGQVDTAIDERIKKLAELLKLTKITIHAEMTMANCQLWDVARRVASGRVECMVWGTRWIGRRAVRRQCDENPRKMGRLYWSIEDGFATALTNANCAAHNILVQLDIDKQVKVNINRNGAASEDGWVDVTIAEFPDFHYGKTMTETEKDLAALKAAIDKARGGGAK